MEGTVMSQFYHFTPWHCLLGGLSLGIVSAGKTAFSSRILGISGSIKCAAANFAKGVVSLTAPLVGGFLSCDFSTWRWLFLGGMGVGAAIVASTMPGALEQLPSTYTFQRAAIGGLLVGAGAALGNGCTSGHGIAGISRLSVRSIVYTATFMLAGAAAVKLTGTMEALQIPSVAPTYMPLAAPDAAVGAAVLGCAALGTALLAVLTHVVDAQRVSLAYEALSGVVFSLGLGFSQMTRPSKVASFLAVLHPSWNASLAFVMGGALLVATPAMLLIRRRETALDGSRMSLPAATVIDLPLVLGGLLFGAGWGMSGMCPGPTLVSLAQPSPQVVVLFVAMLAGLRLGDMLKPACAVNLPQRPKAS